MNPLKAIKAIFAPLTKAERRQAGIILPEERQKAGTLPSWERGNGLCLVEIPQSILLKTGRI